jgi:hypothetical protein
LPFERSRERGDVGQSSVEGGVGNRQGIPWRQAPGAVDDGSRDTRDLDRSEVAHLVLRKGGCEDQRRPRPSGRRDRRRERRQGRDAERRREAPSPGCGRVTENERPLVDTDRVEDESTRSMLRIQSRGDELPAPQPVPRCGRTPPDLLLAEAGGEGIGAGEHEREIWIAVGHEREHEPTGVGGAASAQLDVDSGAF